MNLAQFTLGASGFPLWVIIVISVLVILFFNKNLRDKLFNAVKGISAGKTNGSIIKLAPEYKDRATAFKVVADHINLVGGDSDFKSFESLAKLMFIDKSTAVSTQKKGK